MGSVHTVKTPDSHFAQRLPSKGAGLGPIRSVVYCKAMDGAWVGSGRVGSGLCQRFNCHYLATAASLRRL
ncbi:hypothetical protein RRG08_016262 [Elysia crispata]|uniref:Uncharacterized protein n=1 Tax=Elysia crispata TaxID=231223 RepID=A0AAE1E0B8_9GAST|nr:hypothetical protein RRG08_016262 [Elysia crispata]